MGACAAVPTTCIAARGAITCILRRCVHNKDDHNKDNYNEDDHTGFHFQFSPRGRGTQGGDSVQRGGGA